MALVRGRNPSLDIIATGLGSSYGGRQNGACLRFLSFVQIIS